MKISYAAVLCVFPGWEGRRMEPSGIDGWVDGMPKNAQASGYWIDSVWADLWYTGEGTDPPFAAFLARYGTH